MILIFETCHCFHIFYPLAPRQLVWYRWTQCPHTFSTSLTHSRLNRHISAPQSRFFDRGVSYTKKLTEIFSYIPIYSPGRGLPGINFSGPCCRNTMHTSRLKFGKWEKNVHFTLPVPFCLYVSN